jgi:isocitrate/isopropylmalate dehydrogenase
MSKKRNVAVFHQANIQKECHMEFLMNTRESAKNNKNIRYEEMLLGEGLVELIRDPEAFEIILLPNNCGDATSSIAMSLVGGNSLAPSVHLGEKFTIFEQGGNNPCLEDADKKSANPTGLILAASMMLRQADLPHYADIIDEGVFKTYENEEVRTLDLGGNYSTEEFVQKIIENIFKNCQGRHMIGEKESSSVHEF